MKTLKLKNNVNMEVAENDAVLDKSFHNGTVRQNLVRVSKALAENGYEATEEQCFILWHNHSLSIEKDWAELPSTPTEIFELIKPFIK